MSDRPRNDTVRQRGASRARAYRDHCQKLADLVLIKVHSPIGRLLVEHLHGGPFIRTAQNDCYSRDARTP